jgi:HlyD family secretion protein
MKWFKRKPPSPGKASAKAAAPAAQGQPVVEYLPDADEIERSPLPRLAQFTLHILIVAMVVFLVWACVSELDEVVTAQGRLASPLPNVVVQPLETAIVQTVDVRIGQVVKKGDRLATLDATFAQADEAQLKIRLDSLETQIQGLEAELSGALDKGSVPANPDQQLQANLLAERRASYRAQQDRLSENMAKLRAALQTSRKDQQMVQSRLRSVKEIEAMQEKMVQQKYAAPLQLLEAQQRSKEVERELEQTSSHEQELKREYAALEAEKLGFEKNWRQKAMEEMLTVTRERDGLLQQIQKADKRNQMITLQAPVDAVVLDIAKLSPGSIVQGAETFFTLVPLNTKLEAEVQINSMDVGYIKVGDKVHLKLDAFPFQRHGTLDGSIRTISEDAFRRDATNKGGLDAYYLSRITLDGTTLRNMIESARLLPGMTLNAEVVVGHRTIISYLAWPLTKGLDEAVREPK